MIAAYYSFSLFFIFLVVVVNGVLYRKWKGVLIGRLPFFIFTFFYLLISFVLPLLQEFNGYYRYVSQYETASLIWVSIFSAVFYIVFLLVYLFCSRGLNGELNRKGGDLLLGLNCRRLFVYSFFVFLIGFAFSVNNAMRVLTVGMDVYFSDRLSYGGFGLIGLLAHFIYVASILFFVVFKASVVNCRPKLETYLYGLVFLLSMLYTTFYYMINGNRNSVFLMLVIVFCLGYVFDASLNKKRDRRGSLPYIIGAIVLMVAFSFWGFLRSNQMNVDDLDGYTHNMSHSITVSLNGAFGNNENNLWLIENSYERSWGITYIAAITNFVPRSLWPDKPLGAGPAMRNIVYPGSYVIGQPGNTSYTTGLLNELVINFGFIFSLLLAPLVSFLYARLTVFSSHSADALSYLLGFIALILISSHFLYAEFLGFFVRTFFTLLPLMFLVFVRKLRLR